MPTPPATHPSSCPVCGGTGGREVLRARDHRQGMPGEFRVVECPTCLLCRTDPWPDDPAAWYPDDYPQHDPRRASVTARASGRALSRAAGAGRRAARVIGIAIPEAETGGPLRPGSRVLDVGAGTGMAVAALRDAGHEAWGLEPSESAVRAAQEAGNAWVVQGSLDAALHEGRLPDGPWDMVRMSQVLEHVPDPVSTLRAIAGILAPGGRLVVGVPNIRSLTRQATGGAWDGLELPRHLVHYDRDSLAWVLGLAGLRVVSVRTVPLMGVLPGSLDARTARGERQRGWGDALPVRAALYPVEWGLGVIGQGDGLLAVARPAR